MLVSGVALASLVAIAAAWSAWDVARFDVASLAKRTPDRTALMRQREAEARRQGRRLALDVRTVPYERISPLLRRAVLVAEDDAFFRHGGFDWNEVRASARRNLGSGRVVRGGSTITQQLAKNLFLGSERSLTRKLREALLAVRLERALTKRRIFELYLNRIEWGPGIFGAEAAARRYFGVPASALSPRQAVRLAAVIINPVRYSPLTPSPRIERRVRIIAGRLRRRGDLDEAGYRDVLGLPPPEPPALPEDSVEAPPDGAFPPVDSAAAWGDEGTASADTAGGPPDEVR